jgi:hypothetical protein
MSASNLALTTLFLATMFAETEWREFTSSEGNFRVVFPEAPQKQKGTERNRHQFSAAAGAESYGLTYADHSPSTDWESVVNGERDSIVNGFGGSVVDEKRTSVEGYPGKWIRFAGRAANSPSTSSGAACMCCTLLPRRGRLGRRIFLHF